MKALSLSLLFSGFLLTASPLLLWADSAAAVLKGTTADSKIAGNVKLEETGEGLKITAEVSNATPGRHGFHIHENGSCEDGGKAAGSHFNPDHSKHGLLAKDGPSAAHAGDLGNIEIGADGAGKYEATIPGLSLSSGRYNVAGKSIILHEKEDDLGQPVGNSGGRIGCGVIEKEN